MFQRISLALLYSLVLASTQAVALDVVATSPSMGALVLSLLGIIASFAGGSTYPTLDFWPRGVWSVGVAVPLAVLAILLWKRLKNGPGWFHLAFGGNVVLGTPLVAYAFVVWLNGALSPAETQSHTTEVQQKLTRSSGRGQYETWLQLRSWRPGRDSERVRVSKAFHKKRKPGDRLIVTTRPGLLGMEFWTNIKTIDEPGK